MNTSTEKKKKTMPSPVFKQWYVSGPLISVLMMPALMIICAWGFSKELLPAALMGNSLVAALFLAATAGAAHAAKKCGRGVLIGGGATGLILAGIIVIFTILLPNGRPLSASCLRMAISVAAGGLFGGALCLGKKSRRPNTRRNRKR